MPPLPGQIRLIFFSETHRVIYMSFMIPGSFCLSHPMRAIVLPGIKTEYRIGWWITARRTRVYLWRLIRIQIYRQRASLFMAPLRESEWGRELSETEWQNKDGLLNMRLDNFVVKGGSLKMQRSLSNIATRYLTVVRGKCCADAQCMHLYVIYSQKHALSLFLLKYSLLDGYKIAGCSPCAIGTPQDGS